MKKMGRVRLVTEAPQILGPAAHVEASHSSVVHAVQAPHSSRVLIFRCRCTTFPGSLTFQGFFKLRMNGNLIKIKNMRISLVENCCFKPFPPRVIG